LQLADLELPADSARVAAAHVAEAAAIRAGLASLRTSRKASAPPP